MGTDRRRRAPADRPRPGRLSRSGGAEPRGRDAELAACNHLRQAGLRLLQRNFRARRGEIDLIMQDGDVIVFIEVRSRGHARFLHPAASVDARKQQRLIHAAQSYLQRADLLDSALCRFDVVSITGNVSRGKIEWIKGAFEA